MGKEFFFRIYADWARSAVLIIFWIAFSFSFLADSADTAAEEPVAYCLNYLVITLLLSRTLKKIGNFTFGDALLFPLHKKQRRYPLVFAFNDFWAGCIIIGYAICFNIPLIAIQRYNRNCLLRVLALQNRPAQIK
ncbi:hypothetical protein [Bacillus sp. OV322]|uniref:hypothetical protein n=1 Tax=Bacillus sp. OV322 TaxID=1882764 RepID=UPI00114D4677|nr:hypothetical protein [Bacillus sp. OV322]